MRSSRPLNLGKLLTKIKAKKAGSILHVEFYENGLVESFHGSSAGQSI